MYKEENINDISIKIESLDTQLEYQKMIFENLVNTGATSLGINTEDEKKFYNFSYSQLKQFEYFSNQLKEIQVTLNSLIKGEENE